jgi:hypothetical protein
VSKLDEDCRVLLLRDMSKVLGHYDVLSNTIKLLEESLQVSQEQLRNTVRLQSTKEFYRTCMSRNERRHLPDLVSARVHVDV